MMPWNVVVASPSGSRSTAATTQRRLAEHWRGAAPLNTVVAATEDLETDALRGVDAVVLLADRAEDAAHLLPQLASIEEESIAVLTLLGEPLPPDHPYRGFTGALLEQQDAAPETLCAKLEGVLHRQREVGRLRRELSLAYRFHGGLKGEISRMHEELQLAAMVQREFLPRELPCLHGVAFSALWRPAHYVSGDIYDVSRLDDDHVGIFIADAVGHGVPAALMTMVICRSLTTKLISGSAYRLVEPSEVLGRLNEDLIRRQGRTTRFATAVYAVVDCRSRTMRLAGAGHPPPILLGEHGESRELETPGGLLGIFDDEQYEQIEIDLALGDRVLLYSDGFEQAFPLTPTDAYERRIPSSRYRDEFHRLVEEPSAPAMIETIGRRLDDQAGSLHQVDDLTLVCLRAGRLEEIHGHGPHAERTAMRSAYPTAPS